MKNKFKFTTWLWLCWTYWTQKHTFDFMGHSMYSINLYAAYTFKTYCWSQKDRLLIKKYGEEKFLSMTRIEILNTKV